MVRIMVVGSGTMGVGIAEVALMQGFEVVMTDPDAEARRGALHKLQQAFEKHIHKGRASAPIEQYLGALTFSSELLSSSVDWVIEAVPERLDLKQQIFSELDAHYPASVWLASNTSSISIAHLQARATQHPERIGGLHFFNPVPRMGLVEIIRGLDTSEEYLHAAEALVVALGKQAVVVPDRPGFLVNRIARPYYLEALRLVDEGVAPMEAVDTVMQSAGFPMGPFRVMDLVGTDVNLSVTTSVFEQTYYDERYRPHPWQQQLVARGYWGRKRHRGFYRYDD